MRRQDNEMRETAKHSPGPTIVVRRYRTIFQLRGLALCAAATGLLAIPGLTGRAWAQDVPTPVVTSAPAVAQQLPYGQGPQPRQEPDERTPTQKAAENYDAPGVRVGSFLLFPELELEEAFNDNIYATSNATGKTGSFIQVFKPSVKLNSDWSTHMLNFYANGNFALYTADSSQNYQDFSVGADGRYDIERESNAFGGVSYSRNHEALGTPNNINGQAQPNVYYLLAANAGYTKQFDRIKTRLDGSINNYNYLNNANGTNNGVILNSDRNRTEFREAARVGYEFIPGYEVWTRGSLNQRQYQNVPDSGGFYRNSSGFDIVGGFALDLGGITSLEFFGGYLQQNYVDTRFVQISTPTFGLAGYWNPYRPLWIKPYIKRTVDDTSQSNDSAYVNTSGGLDVNYNMRPNIRLDGHAEYMVADYQAISNTPGARYDQYYTFRVGLLYLPTPNFFVGPTYQFVHRTSNVFNNDYDQNMILLRLGARL
jgi:hypothetical protein